MLRINDQIALEEWELAESFTRASGPGGQNVNKVSSAVELRFAAARSPNLPAAAKHRLTRLAGRRWTLDGAVIIRAETQRYKARNREEARERMADIIARALERTSRRIATRPTLGSKRRRVEGKKHRGAVKALRQGPAAED